MADSGARFGWAPDGPIERRTALRLAVAGTVVATAGPGSVGTTAAGNGDYDPPDKANTSMVSTRGHFYEPWYSTSHRRRDGVSETEYDTSGNVPGVDGECPPELAVYVHGYKNDEEAAAENFNDAEQSLRDNQYGGAFTGFTWDSNPGLGEFADARNVAKANGCKLGQFLLDFRCECPDAPIHLMAHSLGSLVVKHALKWLDDADKFADKGSGVVESVHLFGAAIDEAMPARCRSLIERVVGEFYNYWNHEDDVLSTYYAPWGEALGEDGVDGDPPDNYTDEEVTDEVGDDHSGYNGDDEAANDDGVMDDAKENMESARTALRSVEGEPELPGESRLDELVATYNDRADEFTGISNVVGDSVTLHVVEPRPPGWNPEFDVTDQPVLGSYWFEFDGATIVGWESGARPASSVAVYATDRALDYVIDAGDSVAAFRSEREDGNVAIKGRSAGSWVATGCGSYAVDTQRAVVTGWRRTVSVVRVTVGV